MTLRLSSSIGSNYSPSCGNPILDRLLQDTSVSFAIKTDCLSTLQVVVKNLVDPIKSQDVKYRTLKLDNAKLQSKLWNVPHIRTDVLESICGFVEVDGAMILLDPPSQFTMQSILKPLLDSIGLALNQLNNMTVGSTNTTNTSMATNNSNSNNNKKPKLQSSSEMSVPEKLSEKQKAKRLLEEKQRLEREQARVERQRQLELLKQDKLTRETDPNWKPGLSAACAKSGTSISTFRDKYGEN